MTNEFNIEISYNIKDKAYVGNTEICGLVPIKFWGAEAKTLLSEKKLKENLKEKYGNSVARKIWVIARKYRTLMNKINKTSTNTIKGQLEIKITDTGVEREKPELFTMLPPHF